MKKSEKPKWRPYLATFSDSKLPVLALSAREYQSDLEPIFHNMAKAFADHKTNKLQQKLCIKNCVDNKKCSKRCLEERKKRSNAKVTVDKAGPRLAVVMKSLERGENPDTIVMVDCREFACAGIVLGSYSKFFNILRGHTVIDLRKGPLKANTFEQVYKWMLNTKHRLRPRDLVRLVRAAIFLEMPDLLQCCYSILDSDLFKNFWAFDIMYRSRHSDLFQINQAMASRITYAAPIIICSREFLSLNEMQVCTLLNSSSLSVNSETELLYAALIWLDVKWPERKKSVLNVMRHIRFAYLSPKILCQLNESDCGKIAPFENVLKEFVRQPESKKLVEDGIFYSTLVITLGSDGEKSHGLSDANEYLMMARDWMQDTRCAYHRPVTMLCPNMRLISFEEFMAYSDLLQDSEESFERYIIYPNRVLTSSSESSARTYSSLQYDSDISQSDNDSDWSWFDSDASINNFLNNISFSEVTESFESELSPRIKASAEESAEHWQNQLEEFTPSEIWGQWENTFLSDASDDEDFPENKSSMLAHEF